MDRSKWLARDEKENRCGFNTKCVSPPHLLSRTLLIIIKLPVKKQAVEAPDHAF
ncbi:hypothetical protein RO3G_05075 [Rhizopus delemar RA 99-880]|uniref:Uncharacterized protein n=1 Tax=Rhizopus delemar (strain RA 99-880 / ATCC MYA-4621 / FGSC 9543 / NRRL 43880) TaxID=246409 RepID=I1BVZ0_RHIO9|nr:hypothetical protein RO3G_05075 [Rhizopus delemar RA 99-880]|eukprot:EIE80370.1 hypothetical protein RO3G_05075 [Rhizopus delemar RA 99-880]